MLTVLYFLSQLCTYTPGIVFYGCGDIVLAKRLAENKERTTRASLIPGPNAAWNKSESGNTDASASFAVKEDTLALLCFPSLLLPPTAYVLSLMLAIILSLIPEVNVNSKFPPPHLNTNQKGRLFIFF